MNTKHYDYQKQLESVWTQAVAQYQKGQQNPEAMFDAEQQAFLTEIGITPREVFDFAEDYVEFGEPDFATFAMVHDIRRSYFRENQGQKRSDRTISTESLPARQEEAAGLPWLPRILAKAKAKLRGELSDDIMYGCGGDRNFLSEHDIHPAEFLRKVWEHEGSDAELIDWVRKRSRNRQGD